MKSDTMDICNLLLILAFLLILSAFPIVGIVMHLKGDAGASADAVDVKITYGTDTKGSAK